MLPTGHPEQGTAQANLAMMLAARRTRKDLDAAVALWRTGLARVRPGTADWAVSAGQLGQGLYELFTLSGEAELLQEANALLEQAVRALPSVRGARSTSAPAGFEDTLLGNRAVLLMTRHQVVRPDPNGLDESIAILDDLMRRTSDSGPAERAEWAATHLSQALVLRHMDRGDPADLARASALGKVPESSAEGLEGTSGGPLGKFVAPGSRMGAAAAIGSDVQATVALFGYLSDARQADVDQAIRDQQKALDRCGDDVTLRGMLVINLALTLVARHHARRDGGRPGGPVGSDAGPVAVSESVAEAGTVDLTRALSLLGEHTGESAPAQHRASAIALSGMLLLDRYVADPVRHAEDPAAAERLLRDALDDVGLDYRSRIGVRLRLAYCQLINGRSTSDPVTLNAAADTARCAVEEIPAESPLRAAALGTLADILLVRAETTGLPEHQREASELCRQICRDSADSDRTAVFLAARGWFGSAWRRGQLDEVAEAGRIALRQLHDIAALQLGRDDKAVALRQAEGLAARTAFALVATGGAEAAATALETGRAVMLAEVMQREHPDLLRLLSSEYRNLSARFRAASQLLGELERRLLADPQGLSVDDGMREAYRQRLRAWDDVVRDIRRLPGFTTFLRPPSVEDLYGSANACRSTLVYLAATERGGIAVLVPGTSGNAGEVGGRTVRAFELPELTPEFERNSVAMLRDVVTHDDEDEDDRRMEEDERCMDELVCGLWKSVMSAVVGAVGAGTPTILIPDGLLGMLPLHAAARPDPQAPTGRRYVIDDVPIATAPSARTLSVAVARTHRTPVNRLLAVRDPEPFDGPPLPGAVAEIQRVRGVLPREMRVRELHGVTATRQHVQLALEDADICHFACHAQVQPDRPLDAGLSLAGGERLTVRDMFARPAMSARLAVLSACDSGHVDESLPDEVVGLATGFMQAGFGAVIASQWPVEDAPAAAQMAETYRHWLGEGMSLPAAVGAAMAWLRDSTNEQKHMAFPELADFAPEGSADVGSGDDPEWAGRREHSSPLVWAAFGCVGI
ncbi:CHAT domain-containing protein [Streptomyces sp. NPDC051665]|uniref:CHAT domain-containing protein n=1 Tax=Streptomyces sp. NPDC051665 TaxID=3154647 RepID=UPI003414BF41